MILFSKNSLRTKLKNTETYKHFFYLILIFLIAVLIRFYGYTKISLTVDEPNNIRRGMKLAKALIALFNRDFDPVDWDIYSEVANKPAITVAYIIGIRQFIPYVPWLKITSYYFLFRELFVLVGGLTCVVFYLLAKDLFDTRTALISSLLLALNPFHVSLSYIIGVDSVTTFFTLVTLWTFLRGVKTQRRIWWGISAIAMGMGTLTKLQTVIIVPIIFIWMFFFSEHERYRQTFKGALRLLVPYCAIALMTFYALWPWLWPNPISQTLNWLNEVFTETAGGHITFYLGRSTTDPGWSYYLVSLIFKLTAPEFLGIAFFIFFLLRDRPSGPLWNKKNEILAIFSWIILYVLFLTLIPSKIIRYALPIFPAVLIFSALGWISLLNRLSHLTLGLLKNLPQKFNFRQVQFLFSLVLLSAQAYPLFSEAPDYYYDYFNPLLGGSKTAVRVISIGWGEGLDVIADYIEDQEDDYEDRWPSVIIIGYRDIFNRYYKGPDSPEVPKKRKSNDISLVYVLDNFEFIVFQLNHVQRQFHEDIWIYFSKFTPEFTLEAYGLTLFWVFRISSEMK